MIDATTILIHVVFYHELSVQQCCGPDFPQYLKLGANIGLFTVLVNTPLCEDIRYISVLK